MAPTTLLGQRTTTTPRGREAKTEGHPLKMAELISGLEAPYYVARVAVDSPAHIARARKAILRAFQIQVEEKGFSFVEVLGACPLNWGLSPTEAIKRVQEELIPCYPLEVFKDKG